MLIAGFDAGQTHTRCRLERWLPDTHGNRGTVLSEGEGSGVCHLDAPDGESRFGHAIRSSLSNALAAAGLAPSLPIQAAVVGASGIEQGTDLQQRGQQVLSEVLGLPAEQSLVTGDERTALHGAFPNQAGIALISGTGMICLGRNADGDEHRCGGWGWKLDGGGSAFDIGHQGLQLSLRMADGRSSCTSLRGDLWDALGCTSPASIKALAAGPHLGVAELARLAPIVHSHAEAGDPQALQVIHDAACALSDAVVGVAEALKLAPPTINAQGGAITHLPLLRSELERQLNQRLPGWHWSNAGGDACDGALSLARELIRP